MGQFRGGMNEVMRQAARLQRKVEQTKKELEDREVVASSVGDRIKVTVTYGGKVSKIDVDPALVQSEGLELALDGVVAAVNSGLELASKEMSAELDKVTGGLKIPGFT